MQILRQIFIIAYHFKFKTMDIIKIGRVPFSVEKTALLFENDNLMIERLFHDDYFYSIRVTKRINENCKAVYIMTFQDIISMFACIDFIANPNVE